MSESQDELKKALKRDWYLYSPDVLYNLDSKFLQSGFPKKKLQTTSLKYGNIWVTDSGEIMLGDYPLPIHDIVNVGKQNVEVRRTARITIEICKKLNITLYYKNGRQEILIPTLMSPPGYEKSINELFPVLFNKVQSVKKIDAFVSIKEMSQTIDQIENRSLSEKLHITETEAKAWIRELIANKEIEAKIDENRVIFLIIHEKKVKQEKEAQEEKLKREKEEKLKQEKEAIEKIKKLVKVSDKIKIDMMKGALKVDDASFNDKIIDWATKFGFRISGDELILNQNKVNDFIKALDKQLQSNQHLESGNKLEEVAEKESIIIDPNKEKERKENLINLFKISESVNINDIASLMDLPRTEVIKKLIEWKNLFKFKIDGDFVRLDQAELSNVLNAIDKSFEDWNSEARKSQKKL